MKCNFCGVSDCAIDHAVSDVAAWRISWKKNLFTSVCLVAGTLTSLLNTCQFESFEMKSKMMMMIALIALLQVSCKFFVILGNSDTFKVLKRRIANDDGYFESEMSVELFYRKLARWIVFTLICVHGCNITAVAITALLPFQLPFTT